MDLPLPNLYKEAMDQFAKGINVMVPHACGMTRRPSSSSRTSSPGARKYGPELRLNNQYIGRLQRLLRVAAMSPISACSIRLPPCRRFWFGRASL